MNFIEVKTIARYLISNKWTTSPLLRRGKIPLIQKSLNTTLVVTYARPFTRGDGWKKVLIEDFKLHESEIKLHKFLIKARHKILAHTDGDLHKVRPMRDPKYIQTEIVTEPDFYLDIKTLEQITVISEKMIRIISNEMTILIPDNIDKYDINKNLPLDLMSAPVLWNDE